MANSNWRFCCSTKPRLKSGALDHAHQYFSRRWFTKSSEHPQTTGNDVLSADIAMRLFAFVFCCMLSCLTAQGQGTFRNMDFELAQIPQNQPHGLVAADLAFPFWTVYYGTTSQTQVLWNDVSVGSTLV